MDTDTYRRAHEFVHGHARLLERRLLAALFDGAPASGVLAALLGYQNDDGGFGHALEPDKRYPGSVPGDVEFALKTLAQTGIRDEGLTRRACDYLASVARDDGAVPLAFPAMERYAHAEHWGAWTYEPGLFPTAGLAGLLHAQGVQHPWLDEATRFCWEALAQPLPDDAHVLHEVLVFCEHVPDRSRAEQVAAEVFASLPEARWYRGDAGDPSYGVTPLHLAPSPASPWAARFDEQFLDAHLDRLLDDQQPDGGWPITWEPPAGVAAIEWRGIETVRAVSTLAAYGRISPPRR